MGNKLKLKIMAAIIVFSLFLSPSGLGVSTIVLAACGGGGGYSGSGGGGWGGRPGGVSLDKAATFLADMSDVKSAYFDQATNRIVFLGPKLPANQTPTFNKDDLAVAIRSVVFNNSMPTVSMGDPNNIAAATQPVIYSPGIAKTNFGDVLARADYDLKRYGMGLNSDGSPVTSSVPGYVSEFDRYIALNPPQSETGGVDRTWIEPEYITLKADTNSNSFVFDQVKMKVLYEQISGNSPTSQQAGEAFAQHMTDNYDAFANESIWLKKTKELGKIVGVVKWIKDSGIVSDFSWAKNYKPAYVNTWDTVQYWDTATVNVNGKGRGVHGGIGFTTPNTYNQDNGVSAALKALSQGAAPSQLSDHWTFNQSGQEYQSVAVSANIFRAAGSYSDQVTDLSVDVEGENNLRFSRNYSSIASTTGEIGNGWDFMPARLTTINKNAFTFCSNGSGGLYVVQRRLAVTTADGSHETFIWACGSGYIPEKIEYNSTISILPGGKYSVTTKNQHTFIFAAGLQKEEFPLLEEKDRNNNVLTYEYNSANELTSVKDSQNRALTVSRDAQRRISVVGDWTGRTITYGYDSAGNLISVTDLRGNTLTYAYDSKGRLTGATDRQNRSILSNTFDSENRISSYTNSAGLASTFTYDEPNKIVTATDANSRVSKTHYDSKMRITKKVDPLNNYTEYTYGDQPVPLTEKDKNGNVTTRTLNDWADELSITYPDGKQVVKAYNFMHDPLSISDGRYGSSPKVTSLTYNANGNLATKNEAGITSQYTYDAKGNRLTEKDSLNHQTTNTYNTFGHKLTITNPTNGVTTNTYDSLGRLTQTKDPSDKTSDYTYDVNNNLVTTTNAAGTTTNLYDQDNRLTKVTDAGNKITEFAYNKNGSQTSAKDALLALTSYGYDQYSNMVSRQDALNRTTQYKYDQLNRKTQSTTPLGKVAKWEYDANGNLTKRIDESNRATTYQYDSLNRLKKITYPDASEVINTYDDRGNLVQVVSAAGTNTYTYDVYDRLTSETDPSSVTTTYAYDGASNLTTVTYPDGKTATYTYDSSNRMQTVTDWNNQQTMYQYNPNGSLSSKLLPNGIEATYGYDQASRLASLQYTKNQNLITRFNYERDALGNVTKETETKDAPAQLPSASVTIFGDSLNSSWNTWSSYNAIFNNADTPAHQGSAALSYMSHAWGYVDLRQNSGNLNTAPYSAFSFALKSSQAGQKVYLMMKDGNNVSLPKIDISHFGGLISSTGYKVYTIPLSALNASNKQIKSIQFSNESSNNSQPKIYLDNIKFTTDPANPAVMYDDTLTGDFASYPWSGATVDYNDTSNPYAGSKAIGLTLSMYGGLTIYDYRGINTTAYESVSFAIKGSAANQNLAVQISNGSGAQTGPELDLANYGGNPVNGAWKVYNIPVSSFAPPNGMIHGFVFKNKSNVAQPKILIDEIKLNLPNSNGTQKIATYNYDAIGRVTSANQPDGKSYSYGYDAVGNRTTNNENGTAGTQTYNNDNQLTAKGSRTFTYDNQGNQTGDGSKTLTFDFDNKLKSWTNPSPSTVVTYGYDSTGNRTSKISGGTTHQFVNSTVGDLSKVLVDKNTTANTQSYYMYGDALLSQGGATAASRQYYLTDGTGNVRYVTDSTGTSLHNYTYDPYGNEISSNSMSDYGFQGYEKDRENNLSYLRARYYDPTIGRFISRDPVAGALKVPESQNGYSYVHNNPINHSDPSGEVVPALIGLGMAVWALADMDQAACNGDSTGVAVAALGLVPGGRVGKIIFQTTHGMRHLAGTGLSQQVVENAIKSDILRKGAPAVNTTAHRPVRINGYNIEYRVHSLSDGTTRVGTWYLKN